MILVVKPVVSIRSGIEGNHGRLGVAPSEGNETLKPPEHVGRLLRHRRNYVIAQSFGLLVFTKNDIQVTQVVCSIEVLWIGLVCSFAVMQRFVSFPASFFDLSSEIINVHPTG